MRKALYISCCVAMWSCSESTTQNTDATTADSVSTQTTSEVQQETDAPTTIGDADALLKALGTATLPQIWDDERLRAQDMPEGTVEVLFDIFRDWHWFDDRVEYYDNEPVTFYWKHEAGPYTMVCFSTFEMFAKGGSTEYYVATLAKEEDEPTYYLIDLCNVAANRSISTENPNGGTSVGEELQKGYISKNGKNISTVLYSDSVVYNVTKEGDIEPDLIASYHDDMMMPQFKEGTLKSVVNNIDYITYEFEMKDGSGMKSFNRQTSEFKSPGVYFEEIPGDNDSPVSEFQVKPDMARPYMIRFEKVIAPEIGDDQMYFETQKLTGLAAPGAKPDQFVPHQRTMYGTIKEMTNTDSEVHLVVEEKDSGATYLFLIFDDADFVKRFTQYQKKGKDILFEWEWRDYTTASGKTLPVRRIKMLQ